MWFSSVKAYHFNSIKVRLEPDRKGIMQIITVFQFHKGAIRTESTDLVGQYIHHFNSIKVRLEPDRKGIMQIITVFQFHKGAIRTESTDLVGQYIHHFNSIKVRLERLIPKSAILTRNFNSIKMRLEQCRRRLIPASS